MKLTQLERVNSELKRRFYKQNSTNGISVNTENVIWTKTFYFTFSKGENVLWKCALDCRLGLRKVQGLFSKMTPEEVSANQSRWIRIERPEMDPGGEKKVAGRNSGSAAAQP